MSIIIRRKLFPERKRCDDVVSALNDSYYGNAHGFFMLAIVVRKSRGRLQQQ